MSQPFAEVDYEALLDLESRLEELEQTTAWQALKARAETVLDAQRRRLLGGEIASHEDYLKVSWQLRGAEWVLGGIHEETKQLIGEYRRQLAEREGGSEEE